MTEMAPEKEPEFNNNVISIVQWLFERNDERLHAIFSRMIEDPEPPEAA